MLFDTLPTLILGLPATIGALSTVFVSIMRELTRHTGLPLPESLPFALAVMVAASIAAVSGSAVTADPTRSEEDVRQSSATFAVSFSIFAAFIAAGAGAAVTANPSRSRKR